MAMRDKREAAMLMMGLDAPAAAELLKALPPEKAQEIVLELAALSTAGQNNTEKQERLTRQFCHQLQENKIQSLHVQSFLDEMLVEVLGQEKAEQVQMQVQRNREGTNSFPAIQSADSNTLLFAFKGERPQVIAVILSTLPPEKSREIIEFLAEEVRTKVVCEMTRPDAISPEIKRRVAAIIEKRIEKIEAQQTDVVVVDVMVKPEENLRKVAIVLSGMDKELRDSLLDMVKQDDEEIGAMVSKLMVTWDDILTIADRSIQEALRSVNTTHLAVALYGADKQIVQKIRSNISERDAEQLDEESSLMQEPLEEEIIKAREEIVKPLRKANEEGQLRLVGR